jgi:thymidylate kinase
LPAVALDRIKSRNRFEEQNITIDQLQNIHSKYESWISNGASGFKFVIIDANNDAKTVQEQIMFHLKEHHILK